MSAPTGPARQAFAYAAIIIHPSENRILALPAAAGWALPRWPLDDGSRPYWQTVDGAISVGMILPFRRECDLPMTVSAPDVVWRVAMPAPN